jgi:orotate phosphoribosyltransferase
MNIAEALLSIKAVFLSPDKHFTWSSGIKSPIYCDNRLILGYPKLRKAVASALSAQVSTHFPEVELIMGTATAGIAHAAYVGDILSLPMGYVRTSSKGHGRENTIEGVYSKGQKVVVIEDLISTGGSSLNVVSALQEAGLEVLGVVAIFSYNLKKATLAFNQANMPCLSLTNYDDLLIAAQKLNYINEEEQTRLQKWNSDPNDESWMLNH